MSGGGRGAGLERGMDRVQMNEFGIGREIQKFDGLRQLQQRRRCEQDSAGERDDGADRAGIGRLLVTVGAGRLLLPSGFGAIIECGRGPDRSEIDLRQAGLDRGRRLGRDSVEMPERQRKLDRERNQRQPRTLLDVFSEPLHDDLRLARVSQGISASNVIL